MLSRSLLTNYSDSLNSSTKTYLQTTKTQTHFLNAYSYCTQNTCNIHLLPYYDLSSLIKLGCLSTFHLSYRVPSVWCSGFLTRFSISILYSHCTSWCLRSHNGSHDRNLDITYILNALNHEICAKYDS